MPVDNELITGPSNQAVRLGNHYCAYCFQGVAGDPHASEDHVIGRRFVPRGTLEKSWNLIVNCCERCNSEKANLEDDISAITLYAYLFFGGTSISEVERTHIFRKLTGSMSRATSRNIIDSRVKIAVSGEIAPGASMAVDLVGLPQIERARIIRLAEMHVRAFYFWISFNEDTKFGTKPGNTFGPIIETHRNDWGNEVFLHFMRLTREWRPRFNGVAAEGFFKVDLKRHPTDDLLSYALEYNKAFRSIGFVGAGDRVRFFMEQFPTLRMQPAFRAGDITYVRRRESPLDEAQDTMFLNPC